MIKKHKHSRPVTQPAENADDSGRSGLVVLRHAQTKYSSDFVPFFREVAEQLKAPRDEKGHFIKSASFNADASAARDALQAAQQVVQRIGVMMGSQGRAPDKNDIKMLRDNLRTVGNTIDNFTSRRADDTILDNAIDAAETKAGVDLDTLQDQHAIIERGIEHAQQNPNWLDSVVRKVEKSKLVQGVLTAALGPFSGIAGAAYGGIASVARSLRDKQVARQRYQLASALTPVAEAASGGVLSRYDSMRSSGRSLGSYTDDISARGFSSLGGITSSGVNGKGMQAGTSLFAFFDKDAFRARWTKDIYNAIVKGGISTTAGSTSGIGAGLGALLGTLLGGAAAMCGAALKVLLPWVGVIFTVMEFLRGLSQTKQRYGANATAGDFAASGLSSMLGGRAGLGEKGSTLGEQLSNVVVGAVSGALTGAAFAGLPGAIIGAIIGGIGHAFGEKRITAFDKSTRAEYQKLGGSIGANIRAADIERSLYQPQIKAPDNTRSALSDIEINSQAMATLVKETQKGHAATKESVDALAKHVKQQNDTTTSDVEADYYSTGDTAMEGLAGWPLEVGA